MPDHSRRRFLAAGATGLVGAATLAAGDAFGLEARRPGVSALALPVPGLPSALTGLRVAHVSDVHLPANGSAAAEAVRAVRAFRPHVTLVTGDLLERGEGMPAAQRFLEQVAGRLGTFAVIGNWEYRTGYSAPALAAAFVEAGATLLVNATASVRVDGASLAITGLDDPLLGGPRWPDGAGRGADAHLALVHRPGLVDTHVPPGAAHCVLAGHTHGGQVLVPGLLPMTPAGSGRYLSGWYRDTPVPMYVSRGIGTSGVRARFLCPAELPLFTLTAAEPTR